MSNITDTLSNQAENASGAARDAWSATKKTATDAIASGEQHLREQPLPSALQILGIGLVVGGLIGYLIGHSHEEDTSDIARRLSEDLRRKLSLD